MSQVWILKLSLSLTLKQEKNINKTAFPFSYEIFFQHPLKYATGCFKKSNCRCLHSGVVNHKRKIIIWMFPENFPTFPFNEGILHSTKSYRPNHLTTLLHCSTLSVNFRTVVRSSHKTRNDIFEVYGWVMNSYEISHSLKSCIYNFKETQILFL